MFVKNCAEVLTLAYVIVHNSKRFIFELNAFNLKEEKQLMIKSKVSSEDSCLIWVDTGCYFCDIPFTHKAIKDYAEKTILHTEYMERQLEHFTSIVDF